MLLLRRRFREQRRNEYFDFNVSSIMATVSLDFIKKAAASAASKAAAGVRLSVTMSGGDHWITEEDGPSLQRNFSITLKG